MSSLAGAGAGNWVEVCFILLMVEREVEALAGWVGAEVVGVIACLTASAICREMFN